MDTTKQVIVFLALRVIAAVILLQTLFFKFTASEELVYIFSTPGLEPRGRMASGIVELIAAILILYPRTTGIGALLGIGVMTGALFFHLTKLGIEVKGDAGQLFIYALIVLIACTLLVLKYRNELLALLLRNEQPA
ncbi:MAG TPA: DoxX family protein [Flavisolibacter sp.]|nr:DoxX family protein [Flavisolibacter sp.]